MKVDLREELVNAFKFLAKKQNIVEDAHGNVSVFDNGLLYIKPSGMDYEEITTGDVVVAVPLGNGNFIPVGDRNPSVDTRHHLDIYRRHNNVRAICHTHSPFATAFAISQWNVAVHCTEHADYFGHEIRVLPYKDLDNWSKYVILEEGERAVLLGNHGTLTFGKTPLEAVKLAVALESICKKYAYAKLLGDTCASVFNETEIKKWHDRYMNSYGQKPQK